MSESRLDSLSATVLRSASGISRPAVFARLRISSLLSSMTILLRFSFRIFLTLDRPISQDRDDVNAIRWLARRHEQFDTPSARRMAYRQSESTWVRLRP